MRIARRWFPASELPLSKALTRHPLVISPQLASRPMSTQKGIVGHAISNLDEPGALEVVTFRRIDISGGIVVRSGPKDIRNIYRGDQNASLVRMHNSRAMLEPMARSESGPIIIVKAAESAANVIDSVISAIRRVGGGWRTFASLRNQSWSAGYDAVEFVEVHLSGASAKRPNTRIAGGAYSISAFPDAASNV